MSLVEYVIAVGCIAIFGIGGFRVFGGVLRSATEGHASCVKTLGAGDCAGGGGDGVFIATSRGRPPPAERGMARLLGAVNYAQASSKSGEPAPQPYTGPLTQELYSPGIVLQGTAEEVKKLKALLERAAQYPAGKLLQEKLALAGSAHADGGVPNWTRYDGNYIRVQYWDGAWTTVGGSGPEDPDPLPRAVEQDPSGRVRVTQPGPGDRAGIYIPTTPLRDVPEFVLLHHELLHGLHDIQGTNLSKHADPQDTKSAKAISKGAKPPNHEESSTIGLHVYAQDPMTENTLRRQIGIPERTTWMSVCDKPGKCGDPGSK